MQVGKVHEGTWVQFDEGIGASLMHGLVKVAEVSMAQS